MQEIITRLTEQEEKDLILYAKTLFEYNDPEITDYYPIGMKRLPRFKSLDAERVSFQKNTLQDKLNLGGKPHYYGDWNLDIENPETNWQENFHRIFPLNSNRQEFLEYLAIQVLPTVFQGKTFRVWSGLTTN